MKHFSKIDAQTYEISKSVSVVNGKQYEDDITLVWYDTPYDENERQEEDPNARVLVGWYWGGYDEEVTDELIKFYWRESQDVKER